MHIEYALLNQVILILLSVFLFIRTRRLLLRMLFLEEKTKIEPMKIAYEQLNQEYLRLQQQNSNLEDTLEGTIALYDTIKQVCKTLDKDKIFALFRQQLDKYVGVGDCKFIKGTLEKSDYLGYVVVPLRIGREVWGYIAANEIRDVDKFHVLVQQLILGLKRAILYEKVQDLSITDSLTGIYSRRYLMQRLEEEVLRSKKLKYSFAFLMLDIDHFKKCNDTYGHLVGDAILKELSKLIKENTRQIDLLGRYGGEEFAIILSETDQDQAFFVAERICQVVQGKTIQAYDEKLKITVSIGISIFPKDALDAQKLIERADQALYQAKSQGRNRVVVYSKT
ncbi:MAG: GGDEF domain-containing protein [Candidatus Omnitrophica bacterium]|nr:GGDEF domain-containing protein [Candidatus Omnitrophota bacterium]